MEYTTTIGDSHHATYMVFDDNRQFDWAFCEAIRLQIEDVLDVLDPDESYTLEDLCGEVFWGQLSTTEHKIAGLIMARLVASGRLPLCVAPSRHEYPKRYRLK